MFIRLNKFKNKKAFFPLCAIFLVVLISFSVPTISNTLLDILRHPLKLFSLALCEARGLIFYHRNYIQINKLERETGILRNRLTSMQEISRENSRLRDLLAIKQKNAYKVIAASVIGRCPENWASSIIIDKGKKSGIKPQMAVLAYGALAGRVVECGQNHSKVLLINDPAFAVSAICERSRQEGLICGTLGRTLTMKYLPAEPDIEDADVILTSGMSQNYPKGLRIGTVVDVTRDFSGLASYAAVKPAAELSNIEEVLVIVQSDY